MVRTHGLWSTGDGSGGSRLAAVWRGDDGRRREQAAGGADHPDFLVEDEAIISMELEMLLEDLDVEVVGIAMSAADADALVSAHRPDFVTMDINIKGDIDGIAAASDIFVRYGVRSIFVSAYGDPETRTRAKTANPIGWVRKPIDIAALGEAVHQVRQRDN